MKNYIETLKSTGNRIIQIGSHDGIVGEEYGFIEFINSTENVVVMVEPVPQYMKTLKENLSECKSSIQFIGCGVRNFDGVGNITLEGGMSSFKGNFDRNPSIEVKIISVSTLFEQIGFKAFDLLLLDTEGCEREIIEAIDFNTVDVGTIRWEYHNLSQDDNRFIIDKLLSNGYSVDYCSHDSRHNLVAWKQR